MTTVNRRHGFGAMTLAAALIWVGAAAQALTLADCRRITMIHGGEARHVDLGEGRVMWIQWWSLEGTGHWLHIVDCDSGAALVTLTRSEHLREDLPFNRTVRAVEAVQPLLASPVMRGFDQLANRLQDLNLVPERQVLTAEPCACAAAYPELRGDRPAFEMETL